MALSTHDELLMLRKRARRRLVGAIVLVSVSTAVLWNVVGRMPEQAMKPESVDITGLQTASAPKAVAAKPAVAAQPAASQPVTELLASLPPAESVSKPPPAAAVVEAAPAPLVAKPVVVPPKPVEQLLPEPAKPAKHEAPKQEQAKQEPVKQDSPVKHEPPAKPKHEPAKQEAAKADKAKADNKQTDPMAILEGRDQSKSADKPAKAEADGKRFNVQLAALSDPSKVEALKSKLAAVGINARFSKVQTSKGEVTRVRMGPFASRAEADAALRRLAKVGVSGIVVPVNG